MSMKDWIIYFDTLISVAEKIINLVKGWTTNLESEELACIVVNHACAAAATGMTAGVLPGVASIIAGGISIGAIWHMYYAIGKYLNLSFNTDILKAVGSAILSNIVNQLWGVLAIEVAATFIPIIAIPATGLIFFVVTYLSGLTFLILLAYIFQAGGNPAEMTAEEMEKNAKEVGSKIDLKSEFNHAKEGFKKMRKDGSLGKQAEGVDIENYNI